MGLLRAMLLGDWGNYLDTRDLGENVANIAKVQSKINGRQDDAIHALRDENARLTKVIAVLIEILAEKSILIEEEVQELIAASEKAPESPKAKAAKAIQKKKKQHLSQIARKLD